MREASRGQGKDRGRTTGNKTEKTRWNGASCEGSYLPGTECGLYLIATGSQAGKKPVQICISERPGYIDRKRHWRQRRIRTFLTIYVFFNDQMTQERG